MAVDRIIQLKLLADVSNIDKQLKGTSSRLGRLGASFKGFAGAVALDAAITAVGKVTDGLIKGAEEARLYDQAVDTLGLKLSKIKPNINLDNVVAEIDALSFENAFDDADSIEGFNVLLQRTGSVKQSMRGLELAMDLARAKNISLGAAVGEVGNIYKGEAEKLAEYGVTSDETVRNSASNWDLALTDIEGRADIFNESLDGKMAKVNEFIERGFAGLADIGLDALEDVLPFIEDDVLPALIDLADKATPVVEKFGEVAANVAELAGIITDKLMPVLTPFIDVALDNLNTAFTLISDTLDIIIDLLNGDFTGAWEGLQTLVDNVIKNVTETINSLGTAVAGFFDPVVDAFKGGLNTIIDFWNSLHLPAFSVDLPKIEVGPVTVFDGGSFGLWGEIGLPDIPRLARGGIVTSPTLALIGESGPEAVVPLDRAAPQTVINVSTIGDPTAIENAVVQALRRQGQTAGTVTLSRLRPVGVG